MTDIAALWQHTSLCRDLLDSITDACTVIRIVASVRSTSLRCCPPLIRNPWETARSVTGHLLHARRRSSAASRSGRLAKASQTKSVGNRPGATECPVRWFRHDIVMRCNDRSSVLTKISIPGRHTHVFEQQLDAQSPREIAKSNSSHCVPAALRQLVEVRVTPPIVAHAARVHQATSRSCTRVLSPILEVTS